jgi:hypothetical protein
VSAANVGGSATSTPRLPGAWPGKPMPKARAADQLPELDLTTIHPSILPTKWAVLEKPASSPPAAIKPILKPPIALKAAKAPTSGNVAQLKVHFEQVMAIHQAQSQPISPLSPIERRDAKARFATVAVPAPTASVLQRTADLLTHATGIGSKTTSATPATKVSSPVSPTSATSSTSSSSSALQRLGGGTSPCPACRKLVVRLDQDRVVGPYDVAWHAACLVCGADTGDRDAAYMGENEKAMRKGCRKRLDSSAGMDMHGTVWCTRCSVSLLLRNRPRRWRRG